MRRSTLILLIVLAVVVIGGGAYVWLMKDSLNLPWASNSNTTITTTNTVSVVNTTNTTPTTITLPTEVKGDTAATGTLKIGTVDVKISSQQKQVTADGVTADKGQTFLLVYFDAVEPANVSVVDRGIREVKVVNGASTYPLLALKVASTYAKGDRGYLRFSIPEKATGLLLQLGSGTTLQTVTLP